MNATSIPNRLKHTQRGRVLYPTGGTVLTRIFKAEAGSGLSELTLLLVIDSLTHLDPGGQGMNWMPLLLRDDLLWDLPSLSNVRHSVRWCHSDSTTAECAAGVNDISRVIQVNDKAIYDDSVRTAWSSVVQASLDCAALMLACPQISAITGASLLTKAVRNNGENYKTLYKLVLLFKIVLWLPFPPLCYSSC